MAAIPTRMLRYLDVLRKTKATLAKELSQDCMKDLKVDTRELACPDEHCGYTFNYYDWPWVTVGLPPRHNESQKGCTSRKI